MSSKLQRSSVSFRRQGSSGRIWDDPMRAMDLKGAGPAMTMSTDPMGLSAGVGAGASADGLGGAAVAPASQSSRRSQPPPLKRRRGLSSFCCVCVRPPPTTNPRASGQHDL